MLTFTFPKNINMYGKLQQQLQEELTLIKKEGLYKDERVIMNPQGALIQVSTGEEVLNFCANSTSISESS